MSSPATQPPPTEDLDTRTCLLWLEHLAQLVTCYTPITEERRRLYAALLLRDLPRPAFNSHTLAEVAKKHRKWPPLGDLLEAVQSSWATQTTPSASSSALTGTPQQKAKTALLRATQAWSKMFQSHRDFGWVEQNWPHRAQTLGLPPGPRTMEAYVAYYEQKAREGEENQGTL